MLLAPDMLVLRLEFLSIGDPNMSYARTDTYQKIGARMRLLRSEITRASVKAQSLGYHLGVSVDRALAPGPIGGATPSPILEQCWK